MRRCFALLVLLAVLAALPGCNLIGAAAVIMPKAPVPAQFDLPDRYTLIVIEDRGGIVRDTSVIRQVAASLRGALEDEGVITQGFVPQTELVDLQTRLGDRYRSLAPNVIADELGADQIIYAKVVNFRLEIGGGVYQPAMGFHVSVGDRTGRIFPATVDAESGIVASQSFVPVQTGLQTRNRTAEGSAARSIVSRELADQSGIEIARLFHAWKRPEPGDLLHDNQP